MEDINHEFTTIINSRITNPFNSSAAGWLQWRRPENYANTTAKGHNTISWNKPSPPTEQTELLQQQNTTRMLQEIEKLAREGKVPGCRYAVKTSVVEDVEKDWGKPDKNEYIAAAKGTFATYNNRGIVVGSNKGMQIFDIRSYDPDLKVIRPSDLTKVFGKADMTRLYGDQQMIGYQMGSEFRLRFIFPAATKSNPDPGLDHLAILYPAGSLNSMADDPGIEW